MSNLLEEAEALMAEMGDGEGATAVIDGFSIDDVDEAPPEENAVIDARTTTVAVGEDPLSALTSDMALMPNVSATSQDIPGTPLPGSARRSSLTALTDEQVSHQQIATPTLADVRATASGFASSLTTFAQKAAHSVAQAAAGPNAMPTSTNHMIPATGGPATSFAPTTRIIPHVELDNDQKEALIKEHMGALLPGERVIMFLSNLLHLSDSAGWDYTNSTGSGMWCCCMTYYRVVLFYSSGADDVTNGPTDATRPANWDPDCWPAPEAQPTILQMPLASMDRVEKSIYTTANNTTLMGLVMHGKDNGRQLRFTTPSYADTLRVFESIQTYAFPGRRNLGYLFAFESKREQVMSSVMVDPNTQTKNITLPPNSKRFDGVEEFGRQFGKMQPCPWTLYTQMNATYQLCMSYPSILVGPSSLPEASQETQRVLRQTAGFRSEQRLVAMTWSNGIDGGSLWRSAQPKVGLQGNRNAADEFYMRHIGESAASANSLRLEPLPVLSRVLLQKLTGWSDSSSFALEPGVNVKILDLRPRASALANRTNGYGYENTSHYPGTTLQFCNISNIHAVRDSYTKMSTLCNNASNTDTSWMSQVEDSRWMTHIRLILAAAWEAAFWIHIYRVPVLLHCSHGWDRTSQVAVLSQLLLDPYYRTLKGFSCLVQKDFMSFGHPFHTRCAHGEGRGGESSTSGNDEGQISPIFMQFLDCAYQIVSQYPEKFEFNTKYLLVFSEQVYSCRFGNLLCDTERERELVAGIRQRTHSVWEYLEQRPDCVNKGYQPSDTVLLMPLPSLLRNVTLWTARHCLYGPKPSHRNAIWPQQVVPPNEGVAATPDVPSA